MTSRRSRGPIQRPPRKAGPSSSAIATSASAPDEEARGNEFSSSSTCAPSPSGAATRALPPSSWSVSAGIGGRTGALIHPGTGSVARPRAHMRIAVMRWLAGPNAIKVMAIMRSSGRTSSKDNAGYCPGSTIIRATKPMVASAHLVSTPRADPSTRSHPNQTKASTVPVTFANVLTPRTSHE